MNYKYCIWDRSILKTEKRKEIGFCCRQCEYHYMTCHPEYKPKYFNKLNPDEPNGIYN